MQSKTVHLRSTDSYPRYKKYFISNDFFPTVQKQSLLLFSMLLIIIPDFAQTRPSPDRPDILFFFLDMKLSLFLLLDLAFGVKFFISPGTKKCLKEEIHKDVVVTGDFSFTPSPKHRVSIESGTKSCKMGLQNCILKL